MEQRRRATPSPLKLVLCTSGGLPGALVMRCLAQDPRVRITGLVVSGRILGKCDSWLQSVWKLYRKSGVRYLLYLWSSTSLAALLGRVGHLPPVHVQAATLGCPVLTTRDVNDQQGRTFIDACAADLLVSAFFNQRIGSDLRDRPAAGSVNIHPSLLPDLKGVDPVFHARLRGVSTVGVTLHRLADELDAGALLRQQQVEAGSRESVLRVTSRLYQQGAAMLLENLDCIAGGDPGSPQQGQGSYDSWPTRRQVSSLRREGTALVSAADLATMVTGRFD